MPGGVAGVSPIMGTPYADCRVISVLFKPFALRLASGDARFIPE